MTSVSKTYELSRPGGRGLCVEMTVSESDGFTFRWITASGEPRSSPILLRRERKRFREAKIEVFEMFELAMLIGAGIAEKSNATLNEE